MNTAHAKRLAALLVAFALPCGAAMADAKIVLSLAGEAFDGPPAFAVSMNGKVIGKGVLNKAIDTVETGRLFASAKPRSYLQEFTFIVPNADFVPNSEISIALTNDKYRDEEIGRDRNLFVDAISVNGLAMPAADLTLLEGKQVQVIDYQAGLMPVYESANLAVAKPPTTGWPLKELELAPGAVSELFVMPLPRPAR